MNLEIKLLVCLFLQFLLLCGRLTTRTLSFVHAEYCANQFNFWLGIGCELICFLLIIHAFGICMQWINYVQELLHLKKQTQSKRVYKRRSKRRHRKKQERAEFLRASRSVPAMERLSSSPLFPPPPRPVRFHHEYDEVCSFDSFDTME